MTEDELISNAHKLYHQKGKELNAIEAFKKLLFEYPRNSKGWSYLSAMQYQITDFDGAINSIDKAIEIEPENSWLRRQKCTKLSLLLSYPSEGQLFFNEKTKEAHLIEVYKSRGEMQIDYEKCIEKVLQLEVSDEKVFYDFSWKNVRIKQELGQYEKAIEILKNLKSSIPSKYNAKRKEKQLESIEVGITNNLIELERYDEAIEKMESIKSNSPDNYFNNLRFVELYKKAGNFEMANNILQEAYNENEKKIVNEPEMAFLVRKFELLKLMEKPEIMDEIIKNYSLLKDHNEFTEKRLSEIKAKIKNYQQQ